MATLDKAQLRKFLLVALSSDQPGEVMAAMGKVKSTLKKANLDIHWLADKFIEEPPVQPKPKLKPEPEAYAPQWDIADWREQLEVCANHRDRLNGKELDFIRSLLDKWSTGIGWQPTPRQASWLADIYVKVTKK